MTSDKSKLIMLIDTTLSNRAEASHANTARSTGHKTPEGKERVRFNALQHGMTARTLVLPGEDAPAFQDRIDAWTTDLEPVDFPFRVLRWFRWFKNLIRVTRPGNRPELST